MTNAKPPTDVLQPSYGGPRRTYEFFCLGALLLLLLLLLERGCGLWSMVPVLMGLGGLVGRWDLALPLLLIVLVFVLLELGPSHRFHRGLAASVSVSDLLLCGAVLGYAAGQYRLQVLMQPLVPDGSRRRKDTNEKDQSRRPLAEGEVPLLLLSLPCWALLASLVWDELPDNWRALGLEPRAWRLLFLLWLSGLALATRAVLVTFLSWNGRGRTAEEAVLFLQDLFWRETRREQRRLHRWRTWIRLRHERRKEPS